jgi:hypothetical protein
MPRYFFNIDGFPTLTDEKGEELRDHDMAWREAVITAGEVLRDMGNRLRPEQEWRLQVVDEQRQPLYVIYVSSRRWK